MDNDLMARRLRPPSQPTPPNGQPPAQPASPWDIPLADDASFAPTLPAQPQQDAPFAPPDPAARADVPWDRPAPEAWPPSPAADSGSDYPNPWSVQAVAPPSQPAEPAWPRPDPLGDAAPPWDRPGSDQSVDPDDAMAPVVGDVNAAAGVWHEWSGSGTNDGYANGDGPAVNGAGGGNGILYATPSTPEPMTVAAHSDQPHGEDEPRPDAWVDAFEAPTASPGAATPGGYSPSLSEWPAEDDLTAPDSSHGPVLPEDSWPVAPQDSTPEDSTPEDSAPENSTPPAPPATWAEAEQTDHAPDAAPEPEPAPAEPVGSPHAVTPVVTSAQIVPSPPGSPHNMVLRIELAIVDGSHRANPADAAKRVGPDADVRAPAFNPRADGDRAPVPEPEYIWGLPPADVQEQQRRPRESQQPPQPRQVAPPPSAWPPALGQPTQLDWDLPQVGGPEPDHPAPWSTPLQRQPQMPPPAAPPPTWALTEPTPPYTPEPPQYTPPSASQHQQPSPYPAARQPAWPPSQSTDPLYGLPAAPNDQPAGYAPAGYQPTPYSPTMPAQSQYSVPAVQSAPAAGARTRTGQANAATDQADLWFLSNPPAEATAADDDAQPTGKSSSMLTAGLTVGFALLVIILVLVFIQLMTSLLR